MGLSGVQRTLKFVKYLPDYNWQPYVLTSSSSSFYAFDESLLDDIDGREIGVYRTAEKKRSSTSETKIVKFPSYIKQKAGRIASGFFYQPDRFIGWKNHAIAQAEKILSENDINVIFATAPPFTDFLVALELSQKYKIPFIVDYRDVWIDNPFHYFPTYFHKQYCIGIENNVLTHAAKAIVTTRHTKELLIKRYKLISHDDIVIIPHGWDPEDFAIHGNIRPNPNKFTITHSGVFQDDRTPYYFLKALALFLKSEPQARQVLEARFVGLMRPRHLKLIKKFGLDDVVVSTGYCNHRDAVRHLLESDVLWLMLNDTVRSPGKLYEYFGAQKPMLVSLPDGVVRRTALESKAAIATGAKDVHAIEEAIRAFWQMWKSHTLPKPKQDFVDQFNRKKLTARLAKELALASEY